MSETAVICSSCKERPARSGQRTCLKCHAAYGRDWRARHISIPRVPCRTIGEAFAQLRLAEEIKRKRRKGHY